MSQTFLWIELNTFKRGMTYSLFSKVSLIYHAYIVISKQFEMIVISLLYNHAYVIKYT